MKNNILKIICVLLLILALPVSLILCGMSLPSYYQEAYYAELAEMYDRLYETEGKKIVVVGGSNVAFGLNGQLLEETLTQMGYDYTVCPFGLYAAVGTSAMLDLSVDALGEGDVVILAVEPSAETMSTYFGATAFWKCTEEAPEMLLKMHENKASALVGNYIPYLQERYEILLTDSAPVVEGVYAKSSFNERCDMIYEREGNIMPVGYDTAAPIDLKNVTIAADFMEQVNEYCAAAEAKGASVVLSFSPMNRSAMRDTSDEAVNAYFTLCNESFDCPIISDPRDYVLQNGWFYDNNFHLNTAGSILRTYTLAEELLAYLGCYEELEYELPEMPGSALRDDNEDNQPVDTGDFLYEAVTDGEGYKVAYRISGVTEAGLAKQSLTVPSSYDGLNVVGFADGALDSATGVVQLRLPGTIESLPDNLFANCSAMTTLIMEHTSGLCTVTEHTFDGADQIRIQVPEEAYTFYREGEGCETNPWYPYLDRIETY